MPHEFIPPFRVALSWEGVVATVTVTGEVDCATASALAGRLLEVAAAHPQRLVLDLDGLFFTTRHSARALDSAYKALEKQFPVILRAPRPSSIRRSSAAPSLRAVRMCLVASTHRDGGHDRPGRVDPGGACSLTGTARSGVARSPGPNTLIPVMAVPPPHSRASPAQLDGPTGVGDPVTTASVCQ